MSLKKFFSNPNFEKLNKKNDIKILICYMLNSVSGGLSKEDTVNILFQNNFANYFEASDAFSDLVSNKNIECKNKNDNIFTVTDSGKIIAKQLERSLPITVRDKAVIAALNVIHKAKIEKENSVKIEKTDAGYFVTCNVSGGKIDLMSFTLYAPDMLQAEIIKENFHKDPETMYRLCLSFLTGDKDFIKGLFNK